eukprot:Pgem_evm2s4535
MNGYQEPVNGLCQKNLPRPLQEHNTYRLFMKETPRDCLQVVDTLSCTHCTGVCNDHQPEGEQVCDNTILIASQNGGTCNLQKNRELSCKSNIQCNDQNIDGLANFPRWALERSVCNGATNQDEIQLQFLGGSSRQEAVDACDVNRNCIGFSMLTQDYPDDGYHNLAIADHQYINTYLLIKTILFLKTLFIGVL